MPVPPPPPPALPRSSVPGERPYPESQQVNPQRRAAPDLHTQGAQCAPLPNYATPARPLSLLDRRAGYTYVAQSGVVGACRSASPRTCPSAMGGSTRPPSPRRPRFEASRAMCVVNLFVAPAANIRSATNPTGRTPFSRRCTAAGTRRQRTVRRLGVLPHVHGPRTVHRRRQVPEDRFLRSRQGSRQLHANRRQRLDRHGAALLRHRVGAAAGRAAP